MTLITVITAMHNIYCSATAVSRQQTMMPLTPTVKHRFFGDRFLSFDSLWLPLEWRRLVADKPDVVIKSYHVLIGQ